ncbi:MAG: gamma-glutamyl-gamma-aminobutyrate hydrolase family protein [Pseudomonadota bacterium]
MHIHILETGAPPAPLDEEHPNYPTMFERLLAASSEHFSFSSSAIFRGEIPPSVASFDALLVTGSADGVYEGHDWIAPAEELIRAAAAAKRPQIGVCFGHQLMAQAFGGRVEKSDKGWGVGVHDYAVRSLAAWMTPPQGRIACAVSHQDQVIDLPDGARVLAGSDFCPNGVITYAQGPAISLQPHPEFSHDYAEALMRLRRGRIPEPLVDAGLSSLKGKSDRSLIGQWMANFYLTHTR